MQKLKFIFFRLQVPVLILYLCFFQSLAIAGQPFAIDESVYKEPEASQYFRDDRIRGRIINRLYLSGAVYVGVVEVMKEPQGLRVYLPIDLDSRKMIFKIANEVLVQDGYRTEEDTGQDILTIWWNG